MSNCAKCGAELIGSRRFCSACGAPAVDPRAPAGTADPRAAAATAMPSEPVNPFAVTAAPHLSGAAATGPSSSRAPIVTGGPTATTVTDPDALPAVPPPAAAEPSSLVSPLAVSNVVSQRGSFDAAMAAHHAGGERVDDAVTSAPTAAAPPAVAVGRRSSPPADALAATARKPPGTQLMPSLPRPPTPAPTATSSPSPDAPKRHDRTQMMSAFGPAAPVVPGARATPPSTSKMPVAPPSAAAPSAAPPSHPPGPPHAQHGPYAPPLHAAPHVPAPPPAPAAPYSPPSPPYAPPHAPPYGTARPAAPAWNGWSGAPPPQHGPPSAPFGHGGFGYAPGARVTVTWSTGQRYPATVQQVSGTQCLVVFPDGQQHWVDMQYVAPA